MLRPNLTLLMGSRENRKLELTVGSIRITDSSLYYHRQKKKHKLESLAQA